MAGTEAGAEPEAGFGTEAGFVAVAGSGAETGVEAGAGEMSEVALVGSAAAETSEVGVTVEVAQVEAFGTVEDAEAWELQHPGAMAGAVCYQVCAECLDVPGPFFGTGLSRGHAAEPVVFLPALVS